MGDFAGYEPARKEKIIAGVLTVALILVMVYIAKNNPNPQFVCNTTCHILNFVLIFLSIIIGIVMSSIILQSFGSEKR
jgi:uncharacterized membrane protein YwzB